MSAITVPERKTPWHLWVVGILTLLWNGSGAYTILMAQAGRLADVDAAERAYYAAQPSWFVLATDVALLAPVAAGVALLLRSAVAVWLFVVSVVAVLFTNVYELAAGTSLALGDRGWLVLNAIIVAIAVLQLVYAWRMRKRGVLR